MNLPFHIPLCGNSSLGKVETVSRQCPTLNILPLFFLRILYHFMRTKLLLGLMLMLILISTPNAKIGTWNIVVKLSFCELWKSTLNKQFQLSPSYNFKKSGKVAVTTLPGKNEKTLH